MLSAEMLLHTVTRVDHRGLSVKVKVRRFVLPLAAAALMASSLGTTPASSQMDPLLPSLSADQLLAMAKVDAPPAGVGLELHMDFPVENPLEVGGVEFTALTAVVNPDRSVDMQSAIAGTSSAPAQAEECTDQTFLPTGRKWSAEDLPVEWRFRKNSTPPGNSIFNTARALRRAHKIWPQGISDCKDNYDTDFAYNYLGGTSRSVKYDHTNVVEFGRLSGGALAINYTWFSGSRILETDLRLNRTEYNWTNREGGDRYQVVNVAAHELGHQVGLDDLGDPHGGLTMFGRIKRGEVKKTTLGAGDLRGASRLTP